MADSLRELEMMLVEASCYGGPGHEHHICQSIPAPRAAELLGYLISHLHAREPDGEDQDLMLLLAQLRKAIKEGRAQDLGRCR